MGYTFPENWKIPRRVLFLVPRILGFGEQLDIVIEPAFKIKAAMKRKF